MKKTLVLLLVLVMMVSVVSCDFGNVNTPDTTTDGTTTDDNHESILERAKQYLRAMYKDVAEETAADFTRVAALTVDDANFTIEWKSNNDAVKVTVEDGNAKIDVDEKSANDVEYVLTATITDNDGHSIDVPFQHKVPKFFESGWADYAAACKENDTNKSVVVTGYVTAVVGSGSGMGSMWLQDAAGNGYYVYSPALADEVKASRAALNAEFPVGTQVTATGSVTVYNGCFEFNKGGSVVKTGKTAADDNVTLTYKDATADFAAASGMQDAEKLDKYQGARVELKGVTLLKIDGKNYVFTIGENNVQFILYGASHILDDDTDNKTLLEKWAVGDKADIKGIVNVYSKNFQIYPDSLDSITKLTVTYTDAERVAIAKSALELNASYKADFDLPATGAQEAAITWAVKAATPALTIDGAKAKVVPQSADVEVTLVATIKCGSATDTKEFKIKIDKKGIELKTFAELEALVPNPGDQTADKFYTTGKITEVQNNKYGNVIIEDAGGNKLLVYGMYTEDNKQGKRYDAMETQPAVGDTITVYGIMKNYNGTKEICDTWLVEHKAGTTPPAVETIVDPTPATNSAAMFTMGANGTATHADGSAKNDYTETVTGYTLTLTDGSAVYSDAFSAKGHSCLKLGTLSKVGTFKFTVPADVKSVNIYVAKYKQNNCKVTVNDNTTSLTKNSNDGEFDCITVDVSTNKTVTFTTNAKEDNNVNDCRCMINAIEFCK